MLEVYNKVNNQNPLPTVKQVVDAGASYLVSAVNFSDDCYRNFAGKLPIIPGCGPATESVSQFSKGANLCKIFPAKELGGPAFVKAIDPAIHKTISLVPTGGTNSSNIPEYVDAGVSVLGGSFSMIEKNTLQKIIENQDYKLLSAELKKIKQLINDCRAKKWPKINFDIASVEQISQVTGRNFNLS